MSDDENYYVTEEAIDSAQEIISRFPTKKREVSYKNIKPRGLTTTEIGLIMGIPKRTVDGILARALRKLKIYREVLEDFK